MRIRTMDHRSDGNCRDDTAIFLYLMEAANDVEEQIVKSLRLFTWPQIRYWILVATLVIGGGTATIYGGDIPWEWLRPIAKELGPGFFTAGILAGLVEPFFRGEFARDAFLASFRYVLPTEFKDEVTKILRFEYIAHKQLWTIKVEKINEEVVFVTTSFEKTITNKSKSAKKKSCLYAIPELRFSEGPVQILDCTIEDSEGRIQTDFVINDNVDFIEANTKEIKISCQMKRQNCLEGQRNIEESVISCKRRFKLRQ